jgi:hypothetical protein
MAIAELDGVSRLPDVEPTRGPIMAKKTTTMPKMPGATATETEMRYIQVQLSADA